MRFLRHVSLVLISIWLVTPSGAQQKSLTPEQQQVVDTVKAIFAAAKADDVARFNAVVVPGYYMFDGGKRFDGDAILKLIEDEHAKGVRYEWSVTDPDVHINGNSAWVAYVNRGSITDAEGKVTKMNWLESSFLEKRDGVWKILFFHSTRALRPEAEQAGK